MKKLFLFLIAVCMLACEKNVPTPQYVDLGLPSGTKWKNMNEKNPQDDHGFYTYDEAYYEFGKALPTHDQMQELIDECTWKWDKNGYQVIGQNGNHIFLPAEGIRKIDSVYASGTYGDYWIWTAKEGGVPLPDPRDLRFDSTQIHIHWLPKTKKMAISISVRLVE